jgi:hypothetical protein
MQKDLIAKYAKYFNKLVRLQTGGASIISKELTITDGVRTLKLYGDEIINLELKLNLSPYGKLWKNIGDYLYNYYTNQYNTIPSTLYITSIQFNYLNSLKMNLSNIYTYPVSNNEYQNNSKTSGIMLTDESSTLFVDGAYVSDLLSKLTYTAYALQWPHILMALKNCSLNISPSQLKITTEQMNVLRNLYLRNISSVINQYNLNVSGMVNSSDMSSPDIWDEHPRLNGSRIIFSDGEDNLTVRGEDIYRLYKKIKASKYYKKFKKIRKSILSVQPHASLPILVSSNELEILSMIKKNTIEYIEQNYPKQKKTKK